MKKCPYCAEEVQDEAIKCKHCGSSLAARSPIVAVAVALGIAMAGAIAALVLLRKPAPERPERTFAPAREERPTPVESPSPAPQAATPAATAEVTPSPAQASPPSPSPPPPDLSDATRRAEIGRAVVRLDNQNTQISGSGFLVSADGYALTARHVVEKASAIAVETSDGAKETATVIAAEEKGDVALLRLDGSADRAFLPLGDATTLQASSQVLAVGYPLGLKNVSFTSGIVSAAPAYLDAVPFALIQIDAAINPGSSGGPLLDADGKVVGVVAAKIVGAEAMNFASPVNYAALLPLPSASGLGSETFDSWTATAESKHFAAATESASREPQSVAVDRVARDGNIVVVSLTFKDGDKPRSFRGGVTVTLEYTTFVASTATVVEAEPCETYARFDEKDFKVREGTPILDVRLDCPAIDVDAIQTLRALAVTDGGARSDPYEIR